MIAAALGACSPHHAGATPEVVGDPLGSWRADPAEAFARNLWDLRAYDGRLYLGYGDAIVNTGPTDVIAYDPARRDFVHETVLPEEAISRYRVLGYDLYVPGTDAVGSPDGALYVRNGVGWRTIALPGVVHATDVALTGNGLCVSLQDREVGGAVRCSRDGGMTWTSIPTHGWRAVSLFTLGGALYASSHGSGVQWIHDGRAEPVHFVIPGAPAGTLVGTPTACGAGVVFIAKRIEYGERSASIEIYGAYRASRRADADLEVTRIEVAGIPADVFADDHACYVLTNQQLADGRFEAAIYRSRDGDRWDREVTVELDALARSAERMAGSYYLGLGCDTGRCNSLAGTLIRVPADPR